MASGLHIVCTPTPHGACLAAPLPAGAPGQWSRVSLRLPAPGPWWAKLELADEARGQVVREVFLGPVRLSARATLVHVPSEARALRVSLFGSDGANAVLRMQVLSRLGAALRLLWAGARVIPGALGGSALGVIGRLRATLGQAPARAGEAPPYAAWIAMFERAPDLGLADWDAQIAVTDGAPEAVAASLASAAAQAPARVIAAPDDWTGGAAAWTVILQAGEILASGATARFARAARLCPWAEVLTADCDRLDARGARCDPCFKPGPDSLLPLAALSAEGALAVRTHTLSAALPLAAPAARAALLRAAIGRIAHVPGIASHVPHTLVWGKQVRVPAPPCLACPSVTMLVPSAARSAHVAACLRQVVRGTAYANFTIRLVLAAPMRARASVCAQVAVLDGATVLPVDVSPFNYARVNNEAARDCDSDLLLLLNDDVAPIGAGWLSAMVAHMDDPRVGIVGARLLYGNGAVQHEGVIMGLGNLCEHAGRLADSRRPGAHGIGLLDREVCAVTGACLLIRTSLWRDLGGMDEAYAIALNDVDLCLRAREAGWRVIYCAGAVLHHYESLSLGRHYAGDRAGLESIEVRRLRARFADVIATDPFYSPLASLQPGWEWQPGFPPRGHPAAIGAPTSQLLPE